MNLHTSTGGHHSTQHHNRGRHCSYITRHKSHSMEYAAHVATHLTVAQKGGGKGLIDKREVYGELLKVDHLTESIKNA